MGEHQNQGQGRGSNLTEEDRIKGGEHSHEGGRSGKDEQTNLDIGREGSGEEGKGWHGDPEGHSEAGRKGGSR